MRQVHELNVRLTELENLEWERLRHSAQARDVNRDTEAMSISEARKERERNGG